MTATTANIRGRINTSAGGQLTATADEIIGIDGVVETATSGVLYVTYSKLTDVGGDTSMNAGSFLRVSPVP